MKPLLSLALFSAFAVGAFAQTAPAPAPATPPSAQPKSITALEVARNDNDVLLAWTLPEGEVKMVEVMRNTKDTAPGRDRVASVRKEVLTFKDQVADAKVVYWYWLKVTRPTGEVINIGPVPTPTTTQVWTPTP